MKLELKHLAPYLPYGLKVSNIRGSVFLLNTFSNMRGRGIESRDINSVLSEQMKPILKPLSDLTKEFEHNGEKVNIFDRIEIYKGSGVDYLIEQIRFGFVEVIVYNILLEHHFDVFGLIEKNLAIDINTI